MHRLRPTLLLFSGVLLSLASHAAHADEPLGTRTFVTASMGFAYTPDMKTKSVSGSEPLRVGTSNSPDLTVGGGFGFVTEHTRHLVRVDYHRGSLDTVSAGLGPGGPDVVDESMGVTTILYELRVRQPLFGGRIALHAGGGFGAAHAHIPIRGATIEDWQLGYIGGAGIYVHAWRGIGVDLDYRHVGASEFGTKVDNIEYAVRWATHQGLISIRYEFGRD